jgi:hypothetical protein
MTFVLRGKAFSSPLGFSGMQIEWVDQFQVGNPFEIIHISLHQFPIILQRGGSENRIGQMLLSSSLILHDQATDDPVGFRAAIVPDRQCSSYRRAPQCAEECPGLVKFSYTLR